MASIGLPLKGEGGATRVSPLTAGIFRCTLGDEVSAKQAKQMIDTAIDKRRILFMPMILIRRVSANF